MKTLLLSTLLTLSAAQIAPWGQCGGSGFSGSTACTAGYVCTFNNEWYSQCRPGTATTTTSSPPTTTTAPPTTTAALPPVVPAAAGIAGRSGSSFVLNGKKANFVGSNAYWLPMLQNTADVDAALDAFQKSGMDVLRTWAFADYVGAPGGGQTAFQVWSGGKPAVQTGATGLGRLDYVVAAALKRNIRLILPFVNNWGDYGGMKVYVDQMAAGSGHEAFYTNAAIKSAYKAYVRAVVGRYKDSPAIFAWELANEPRCKGALATKGTCNTATITSWVNEMSAYVKSLDSKHMVALGDEGFFNKAGNSDWFYSGGEGIDFDANLKLPNIDFGTVHLYPSHWDKSWDWGNQWIKDHGASATAANKPVIIEEYGVPRSTGQRTTVIKGWHNSVLSSNIAGDMHWQFGTTLPKSGKTHDDTFTIFTDDADYQSLVLDFVKQMEAKN